MLAAALAERGMGLAYTLEPTVKVRLSSGDLNVVLERYAPTVPGFFLYFPSVARRSAALRLFVETAKGARTARHKSELIEARGQCARSHHQAKRRSVRARARPPVHGQRNPKTPPGAGSRVGWALRWSSLMWARPSCWCLGKRC